MVLCFIEQKLSNLFWKILVIHKNCISLILFLFSICKGSTYPKHDISLIVGSPECAGIRYTFRIKKVDIGIMPGLLSLVYTKFVDGPDFEFCPAIYIGRSFYTETKALSGFSSHSIEIQGSPYYYLDDLTRFKRVPITISCRYCYARTWRNNWRFRVCAGPSLCINITKPKPGMESFSLPLFPLPGIVLCLGKAF